MDSDSVKALRFSAAEELRNRFENTLFKKKKPNKNIHNLYNAFGLFYWGTAKSVYLGATKIQRLRKKDIQVKVERCEFLCIIEGCGFFQQW